MCRLSMLNKGAVRHLGEDAIAYLFATLDASMGGDGIGVAALNLSGNIRMKKGVDFDPDDAARWIVAKERQGYEWFIFHTRMATHGSVCDTNCHPFKVGDLVLAHNGVANEFGNVWNDKSDSETIAIVMQRAQLPTDFLENQSGVFLGFRSGRPFVVKGQYSTNLWYSKTEDDKAWLFASEMPSEIRAFFDENSNLPRFTWYCKTYEEETKESPKSRYIQQYSTQQAWERDYESGYGWSGYSTDRWSDDKYTSRSARKERRAKKMAAKAGQWGNKNPYKGVGATTAASTKPGTSVTVWTSENASKGGKPTTGTGSTLYNGYTGPYGAREGIQPTQAEWMSWKKKVAHRNATTKEEYIYYCDGDGVPLYTVIVPEDSRPARYPRNEAEREWLENRYWDIETAIIEAEFEGDFDLAEDIGAGSAVVINSTEVEGTARIIAESNKLSARDTQPLVKEEV